MGGIGAILRAWLERGQSRWKENVEAANLAKARTTPNSDPGIYLSPHSRRRLGRRIAYSYMYQTGLVLPRATQIR